MVYRKIYVEMHAAEFVNHLYRKQKYLCQWHKANYQCGCLVTCPHGSSQYFACSENVQSSLSHCIIAMMPGACFELAIDYVCAGLSISLLSSQYPHGVSYCNMESHYSLYDYELKCAIQHLKQATEQFYGRGGSFELCATAWTLRSDSSSRIASSTSR